MNREEFDNDVRIEPSQLDVEAVQQAETFFKWAEQSAAARSELDRCKFDLDTISSKLAIRIREDPTKYDLSKVTEGAIDARVKTDDSYIKAYEALLNARRISAILDVMTQAMEQKKRMIEVLTTLHGQQYFAGPSVPHDLVAAWKDHQEKRSEVAVQRGKEATRRRVKRADA